jgi:hypothetical protein
MIYKFLWLLAGLRQAEDSGLAAPRGQDIPHEVLSMINRFLVFVNENNMNHL